MSVIESLVPVLPFITTRYKADFVCFGKIIVELKTVSVLTDEHRAQVINYLHATGLELGLLVNFGHSPRLEYQRFVRTDRAGDAAATEPAKPSQGVSIGDIRVIGGQHT